MPSSDKNITDAKWKETLARLKANEERKKAGYISPDYGKASVEALNRAMSSPEARAEYMAWLEFTGPDNCRWADYERMKNDNIDPELLAKYRAHFEAIRAANLKANREKLLTKEAADKKIKEGR